MRGNGIMKLIMVILLIVISADAFSASKNLSFYGFNISSMADLPSYMQKAAIQTMLNGHSLSELKSRYNEEINNEQPKNNRDEDISKTNSKYSFEAAFAFPHLEAESSIDIKNGHYYGGTLFCDNGYLESEGYCYSLPKVKNAHYIGSTLICNDGFIEEIDGCHALKTVANGQYYGSTLICNTGFTESNGDCQKLPTITSGHYVGNILFCDNGYVEEDGRCQALPLVSNGHYYGSTLVCDNGFSAYGEHCEELPKIANGKYYGDILRCNNGFFENNGQCEKLQLVTNMCDKGYNKYLAQCSI